MLSRTSARYPNGVRIRLPRRSVLVVSSPEAARRVLVDNASNYKKGLGQIEARALLGDGLLTAEGDLWQAQRRSVVPLLRARAVQQFVPDYAALAVRSVADLLADVPAAGAEVDVSHRIADFTLGCLGKTMGFTPPPTAPVIQAFDRIQRRAMFDASTQDMLTPWVHPAMQWQARQARAVLDDVAASVVAAIPEPLPAWATRDGVVSLLLAGFETTASVLAWVVATLARRPMLQDDLAREAAALPDPAATSIDDLIALPLARAVFRETLRLRPPVWLISRRALGRDTVCGHAVRPGDDVVICAHEVLRGRTVVQGATFMPERDDEPSPRVTFGMGPRACPGGSLAEIEAVLWIAHFARSAQCHLRPGVRVSPRARLSQSIAGGLTAHIAPRADSTTQAASPTVSVPTTEMSRLVVPNAGDTFGDPACQREMRPTARNKSAPAR